MPLAARFQDLTSASRIAAITELDGVATSFTVWVTPEEVENINLAVVYGGVQMYLKME